jgi:glyoxylase-like metal-dependent hydrolase (beta-lactamase superfamily II)
MFVIGTPGSGDFTLVDCGLMGKGEYKLDSIEQCGVSLSDVKRVIMTHTHLDHIGCLPEIMQAIPGVEVWMHRDEALPLEKGDARIVFGNRMFHAMVKLQFSVSADLFKIDAHRKLEGGETLSLGGVEFKVVHAPGHSIGSIGLFNEANRLFISGDTIYADGAIGRFDLESADAAQLKRSLEAIDALGADVLLPCHNRIVTGGAGPMITETVRMWGPSLDR